MSLCKQCPIAKHRKHLEDCVSRCDNEYEQMAKIKGAEALFNDLDRLYSKMVQDAQIIAEIEEDYETNALLTFERW